MRQPGQLSRAEIEALLGTEVRSEPTDAAFFTRVADMATADPQSIVFAANAAALASALQSQAGLILADAQIAEPTSVTDGRVLWVKQARLAFALAAEALHVRPQESEIHSTARIDGTAQLGERVRIGPGVDVEAGVILGDDCVLGPRVTLLAGTVLGARVVVQAGAVLGATGFGYVHDRSSGRFVLFPQQGRLVVEDDVHIGANSTIDRGALTETRVGQGTKIDNLVHIAHNCQIGRNVLIAAQTGIAGSSRIADGAVIAGQVGVADHVEIGPGVILGAKCGVPSGKKLFGEGQLFWGIPARPIKQYLRELAKLRRL